MRMPGCGYRAVAAAHDALAQPWRGFQHGQLRDLDRQQPWGDTEPIQPLHKIGKWPWRHHAALRMAPTGQDRHRQDLALAISVPRLTCRATISASASHDITVAKTKDTDQASRRIAC